MPMGSNDIIGGPSTSLSYNNVSGSGLLSSSNSVGSSSLHSHSQSYNLSHNLSLNNNNSNANSNLNPNPNPPSNVNIPVLFPSSSANVNVNVNVNNLNAHSHLQGAGGIPSAVGPPNSNTSSNANTNATTGGGMEELLPLVMQLTNPDQREGVLLELSKKRESFSDLAPILWHSVGTVSALLQEIASIYPLLWPPTLTAHASNRVCNALALLQCVASHPDTRSLFLAAHVPLYLYPFLNTQSKSRPFEYLRLTSLGVIGALVKMDDPDVINFLLQTEIIPLCLRIMESGSELSKTVATFIVQKVLLDEMGLVYVCATGERFYAVSAVLNNMIELLTVNPSVRLLKHIVRCYLRLSDNAQARGALADCLPGSLRDDTFKAALRDDLTVKKWLSQLLQVVGPPNENGGGSGGMGGGPPRGGAAGGGIGAGPGPIPGAGGLGSIGGGGLGMNLSKGGAIGS
jgi:CCR4-NOT transcription complex subunit 9